MADASILASGVGILYVWLIAAFSRTCIGWYVHSTLGSLCANSEAHRDMHALCVVHHWCVRHFYTALKASRRWTSANNALWAL